MDRKITLTAAILIGLAIILGAFAAHSLEKVVSKDMIAVFEKGVKYQMFMGLGLLSVGLAADKLPFNLNWFYRLTLWGVIIFSGFIYLVTFKDVYPNLKYAGAIVPIGGSMMIVGWLILVVQLLRIKKE